MSLSIDEHEVDNIFSILEVSKALTTEGYIEKHLCVKVYLDLIATTGSMRAAMVAGIIPAAIPIIMQMLTVSAIIL